MCHLANCKSIIASSQHCAPLSLSNDSQNERPTLSIDMPSGSNTWSVLDPLRSHRKDRREQNMVDMIQQADGRFESESVRNDGDGPEYRLQATDLRQ